jgi:hypothetical protein
VISRELSLYFRAMQTFRQKRHFTAIIPTRDRCDTLEYSLKTLTQQNYENLEIIVSDNASQDATREIVLANGDRRIRYINTGKRVSMSDNWEFALAHVEKGWVTFLGDDDGFLPGCFDKVNAIIDRTKVQAVKSTFAQYVWPGFEANSAGFLEVPLGRGFTVRSCRSALQLVLQGVNSYSTLPMVYNGGFVDLSAVRAAALSERFFLSCIPDVFSAIALSNTLDQYAYSDEPFVINGASKHSTGGAQFSPNAVSSAPAARFQQEPNIGLHRSIPLTADGRYPPSLQALVYESCAQFKAVFPNSLMISAAEQLQVMLRIAESRGEVIEHWAKIFALHHGIDFDEVTQKVATAGRRYPLHDFRARFKGLARVKLKNEDTGINNILEATGRAGAELSEPLGFAYRVRILSLLIQKLMRIA